ncbi:oligosaccharide flippase family protein, partial [Streptococcus suis]
IFISDLISRSTPLPVMVISSLYYPNVWAIVAGTLVGGFARMALSHAIIPGPTMGFSYRRDHIIEIISFGKWINLASFSTFIGSQSDYIILGIL